MRVEWIVSGIIPSKSRGSETMAIEYVDQAQAQVLQQFKELVKDPKLLQGELYRHTTSAVAWDVKENESEMTVEFVSPTDLEQTAWQVFSEFYCQYHLGFEQFAKLYGLANVKEVEAAIEEGTAPRRVERYYLMGYKLLVSIKRTDFYLTDKIGIYKLRRIKRICEDAMDLPIDEESDVRAAMLMAPIDFRKMCVEQGLIRSPMDQIIEKLGITRADLHSLASDVKALRVAFGLRKDDSNVQV